MNPYQNFQKLESEYSISKVQQQFTLPDKNSDRPPPQRTAGDGEFKFPQPPQQNKEWTIIGYITSSSTSNHSVYKLYEKYNDVTYQFEYMIYIKENDVYVQLEPLDKRIKDKSILADGKVPGKEGLGSFIVHLYK